MDSRKSGFFELISTYFATIYYKVLYESTIKAVQKSSNIGINLANEYRSAIRGYHEAITTSEKYYSGTIKDLWNAEFKTRSPISLPEFVDIVVKLFIPENVHDQLINDTLRDRWMANITHKMVAGFSTRINNLFVDRIIDVKQRDIRLQHEIQDSFNDVLYQIMDEIHHKITKTTVGSSAAVPREQFEKLLDIVKSAKNAKEFLENELRKTREYLAIAEKEVEKLKKQNADLARENEKLKKTKQSVKFVDPPAEPKPAAKQNNVPSAPTPPAKINPVSASAPPAKEAISNMIDEDDDEEEDDEENQIKKIMSARKSRTQK